MNCYVKIIKCELVCEYDKRWFSIWILHKKVKCELTCEKDTKFWTATYIECKNVLVLWYYKVFTYYEVRNGITMQRSEGEEGSLLLCPSK